MTVHSVYAIPRVICMPTRKQVYVTLERAERYRQRVERRTGVPYRVYPCEFCTFFHLTSQGRRP